MRNFQEYIIQGEPGKREKGSAWQTAIGLQAVDGLIPSDYLIKTACSHIEGEIDIQEAKVLIEDYYKSKPLSKSINDRAEEADKVSIRITEILSEKSFNFSPVELITIHKRLFADIYGFAGVLRDYNITKKEWVLNGDTVVYSNAVNLMETLEYDLSLEKKFNYKGLNIEEIITHFAKFTSDLWQIHPFGEGNTRTTALFIIKYLRTLGFDVDNTTFADHSWYFRNSLVRANYNNIKIGVFETTEFLELFFRNLLINEENILKNRTLHINFKTGYSSDANNNDMQSTKNIISDSEYLYYNNLNLLDQEYEKQDIKNEEN